MPWKKEVYVGSSDVQKATRAIIPSFRLMPEPKIRIPPINYPAIYKAARESWIVQTIVRVITQEVTREGGGRRPKFKAKCVDCETEFQTQEKKCPVCKAKVRGPSIAQAKIMDKLLAHPMPSITFLDFMRSIIYHDLIADDWYVGILPVKGESGELVPAALQVEDSKTWAPIADEYGRLGINEYYCPVCYQPDQTIFQPGKCPKCGVTLERTAYVQHIASEITARSSERFMVHGSTGRVLPDLHGFPKMIAVWNLTHMLNAMDEYILDIFRRGNLGGILNFPGYTQDQIDALQQTIETDAQQQTIETLSGGHRASKMPRTLMIASEEPVKFIQAMPSLTEMNAISHYMMGIQAICGRFGVQPISLSFVKSERGGSVAPYLQLEVQNRVIKEVQADKEDILNSFLFPAFGITDWVYKFNEIEPKDIRRDADVQHTKAVTLAILRAEGFDVQYDENGNLVIPQKPTLKPKEETKKKPGAGQKPKVSDASEREIAGTTTERWPHGPRGEPE